jgi:membrane protease YdiL (CAAX protease family)
MVALLVMAGVPVVMWVTQTVLLRSAGLPMQWRISGRDLPRELKRVNRGVTYAVFAIVLLAYPLLRGYSLVTYYGGMFPAERWRELVFGLAASVLYLSLLYLAWLMSGNVRFEVRHSPGRLVQRLAGAPVTALLAAVAEELLFRGVLLADLMGSMPVPEAVAIGTLVFAAAHYVRSVKRYWTFVGHLALGLLFCVAYVKTHALWLGVGLHAGGILVLMGVRPFVRYTGPPWLVGASIFPYAGVVGVAALLLLTWQVARME